MPTLDESRAALESGEVDTVVVALTSVDFRLADALTMADNHAFPSTVAEAIRALESGTMARAAFGDQVVDRYLTYARTEQRLFDQVATGYERARMFERG